MRRFFLIGLAPVFHRRQTAPRRTAGKPERGPLLRAEQFYGIALPAESFAQVVVFAISQPQEVDVNEIVLAASPIWDHPTANGFDVSDHCDPKR